MTILEWLNTIADEEVRRNAIANYYSIECDGVGSKPSEDDDTIAENLTDAVKCAFIWSETPEGHSYWADAILN